MSMLKITTMAMMLSSMEAQKWSKHEIHSKCPEDHWSQWDKRCGDNLGATTLFNWHQDPWCERYGHLPWLNLFGPAQAHAQLVGNYLTAPKYLVDSYGRQNGAPINVMSIASRVAWEVVEIRQTKCDGSVTASYLRGLTVGGIWRELTDADSKRALCEDSIGFPHKTQSYCNLLVPQMPAVETADASAWLRNRDNYHVHVKQDGPTCKVRYVETGAIVRRGVRNYLETFVPCGEDFEYTGACADVRNHVNHTRPSVSGEILLVGGRGLFLIDTTYAMNSIDGDKTWFGWFFKEQGSPYLSERVHCSCNTPRCYVGCKTCQPSLDYPVVSNQSHKPLIVEELS